MQWLLDTFLKYLTDWEEYVHHLPEYTAKQKDKMLLSKQTREGLKMTGKAACFINSCRLIKCMHMQEY